MTNPLATGFRAQAQTTRLHADHLRQQMLETRRQIKTADQQAMAYERQANDLERP